ncbi:glycosyltransferase [Francisella sp. 19X1-34]|uniref:glycosyltransferase n=1 Tax=Francisella sp. 19X1-34 TaxID=3087177 RepID=UPI002E3237D8|nr:glycosyltransferase [Francisella sp. 19X1-34]MED7787563.1 glycosyltransferase [Francisella sp. 19X1-34]
MKILIVTAFFENTESIASQRPLSWAKYWSRDGHDIEVITASKKPYKLAYTKEDVNYDVIAIGTRLLGGLRFAKYTYKPRAEAKKTVQKSFIKESLRKLQDKFCKPAGVFYLSRMPDFLDIWYFNVKKYIKGRKYDLVVTTHGPYQPNLIGYYLKKNNQTRHWIADYRDLWTQSHNFKGLFPFTVYEEFLEKKVNRMADIITTVSEPLAQQLRGKYNLSNVHVIENGYDPDDINELDSSRYWEDDAKVRIVYTGTIYEKYQDPSPLFKAIRNIKQSSKSQLLSNLEIHFFGVRNYHLSRLIENFSVEDYVFQNGVIKRKDSLRVQRDADILLFMEFRKKGVNGVLTGKIFEYISSGTKIWGINTSQESCPGQIILNSEMGILFDNSISKIQQHLESVLDCKSLLQTKKMILFERYSRRNLSTKMLELLADSF